MTYSGTDWRVARYPVEDSALWEPQPGAFMRVATCAVLANTCRFALQPQYLTGSHADSAGQESIRAMPVAGRALVRRSHPISQLKTAKAITSRTGRSSAKSGFGQC